MNFEKRSLFGIGFLAISAFFLAFFFFRYDPSLVRIAFLDVGQGDAFLLSRGSNQILIDTGKNSRALFSEMGKFLLPWDRTIETVIVTHPDQDHAGALPDLLSRYRVGRLLSADIPRTTEMGRVIQEAITSHGVRTLVPYAGLSIELSPDVAMEILFPDASFVSTPKNTNAASIVSRLRVGEEVFLFTGDLPKEELVLPAEDIRVLKVAHHGSKYSTSEAFLNRMKPEEAVISVGKNSYGHPSREVIGRLEARNIRIFRTDIAGTIVYECSIDAHRPCDLVSSAL